MDEIDLQLVSRTSMARRTLAQQQDMLVRYLRPNEKARASTHETMEIAEPGLLTP